MFCLSVYMVMFWRCTSWDMCLVGRINKSCASLARIDWANAENLSLVLSLLVSLRILKSDCIEEHTFTHSVFSLRFHGNNALWISVMVMIWESSLHFSIEWSSAYTQTQSLYRKPLGPCWISAYLKKWDQIGNILNGNYKKTLSLIHIWRCRRRG